MSSQNRIGHFFGAMQIDGFIDKEEFKKQAEAIRSKEGIPLLKPVVDDLLDIANKTRIPFEANP